MKEKVIFMGFYYEECKCKMQRAQIYTQGILRDSPEKTFRIVPEVFCRPE